MRISTPTRITAPRVRHSLREPTIYAAAPLSMQDALCQEGSWERVCECLEQAGQADLSWLADAPLSRPVPLEQYIALVDATERVGGAELLSAVGRRRFIMESRSGFYANVIRSWLRAFPGSPQYMFRMAPHVWRFTFQDAGTMCVAGKGRDFLHLQVTDAARCLLDSTAWHLLVSVMGGTALEVLCDRKGTMEVGPAADQPGALDLLVQWAE